MSPRPLPAASAPGAQVWPGRQVQSALAPGRFPPALLPLGRAALPTCVYSSATAMGARGQLEGCGGARLGGWAGGSVAPGQVTVAAGPANQRWAILRKKFPRSRLTLQSVGGPGGEKSRIGHSRPVARPRCDWRGGGCGRGAPPPGGGLRRSGSTWLGQSAQPRARGSRDSLALEGGSRCVPRSSRPKF